MLYPRDLEDWWLQAATDATACREPVDALSRLEAEAARLSDRFTVGRPGIFADYTTGAQAVAAYGVLFFLKRFCASLWCCRSG